MQGGGFNSSPGFRFSPAAGAGQLGGPVDLAVGPSGDVFVADTANARVQQYEADGDFIRAWGWGVDTDAYAFEACTAVSGCKGGRPAATNANSTWGAPQNGLFFREVPRNQPSTPR